LSDFENPKWYLWYQGGNEKYPPGQIWTADFWHVCEHIKGLCLVGIALSVVFFPLEWYWYLPCYWFEGKVFTYFSHYGFRLDPDGDFKHYLIDTLTFWEQK
jgi:hypothetical protein